MHKTKELNWNPVLKGDGTYCSSACGGGCTKKEYEKAKRNAYSLAKFLKTKIGGNWKIRVWENLGWHYSVSCGLISLSESTYNKRKSYHALTTLDPNMVGSGDGRLEAVFSEKPVVAVKKSLQNLKRYLLEVQRVVDFNNKEFGKCR